MFIKILSNYNFYFGCNICIEKLISISSYEECCDGSNLQIIEDIYNLFHTDNLEKFFMICTYVQHSLAQKTDALQNMIEKFTLSHQIKRYFKGI